MGFGRAFGETMAVTMVIGNKIGISPSLFAPSQTMASALATQYAESDSQVAIIFFDSRWFYSFYYLFIV